ncbi:DUF1538 domain-containing protein [Anaerocolumna sp.]|uniref:DUF1538 domain-containing protein n=1 Tax=Anaerocolumna sp. TaxID=2041569 RepID=UPI0028A69CA5|nr:DUF1538 domain-containing protein [Anaerocolumna sp.]
MNKIDIKGKLSIFSTTLKEVFLSSLPLAGIIIIVCGFIAPLDSMSDYVKLIVGYVSVVLGQTLFLNGLNISILPIGKLVGGSLIKLKKATLIIFFGFLFGLLATVAEPALTVLAKQTNMIMPIINQTVFIWIMAVGIGIMVGFSLFRILKDLNIKVVFAILYIITFLVIIIVPDEFVALAFDGSGATTGDISVPFILALGMGVSVTMSKHKSNDDTFGIIGLASVGPILALAIYGIILNAQYNGLLPAEQIYDPGAAVNISEILTGNLSGVALALLPVIIVFLPFQFFLIKQPKKEFMDILLGTIVVFAGLFIFLSGIDYGFAFAGKYIGEVFLDVSRPEWFKWLLLIIGFILGAAITLSEPAVTVLGEQLEELTNGHIQKMTIRMTLAIGIGFASLLSMVKILTEIHILWFLIPLYAISLILMIFTPKLFVGLAFDSGGVSGGALTSAFLTPLTLGVAQAVAATSKAGGLSILVNGFGIIAFISVTPLIAVQFLGIVYDIEIHKTQRLLEDAEIEDFEELALLAEHLVKLRNYPDEETPAENRNDKQNEVNVDK